MKNDILPRRGQYKAIYLPMIHSPYFEVSMNKTKNFNLFKNNGTAQAALPVERIRALKS